MGIGHATAASAEHSARTALDDNNLAAALTSGARRDVGALVHGAKQAFGQLESACGAIILHIVAAYDRMEKAEQAAADLRVEADVAVQRARLEADVETSTLREEVARLRAELAAYREGVRVICEQPEGAAGEATADGDSTLQQQLADHRAQLLAFAEELESTRVQCSDLHRRLAQERAHRTRLIAAVQALHQATPLLPPPPTVEPDGRPHASNGAPREEHAAVPAPPAAEQPPAPSEAAAYATQLLEHIEAVHASDVASGVAAAELVDRLTCNLDYASGVYSRRFAHDPVLIRAFDEQLATTLDVKGATTFGRHLAIAAHAHEQKALEGCADVA